MSVEKGQVADYVLGRIVGNRGAGIIRGLLRRGAAANAVADDKTLADLDFRCLLVGVGPILSNGALAVN